MLNENALISYQIVYKESGVPSGIDFYVTTVLDDLHVWMANNDITTEHGDTFRVEKIIITAESTTIQPMSWEEVVGLKESKSE